MRFGSYTASKLYAAMLAKVEAENSHLSEEELYAKLIKARDEYVKQVRQQ